MRQRLILVQVGDLANSLTVLDKDGGHLENYGISLVSFRYRKFKDLLVFIFINRSRLSARGDSKEKNGDQ